MKTLLIVLTALTFGSLSQAYEDGIYKCANPKKGLPDDIYNIQTLKIDGLSMPFVEVTRSFLKQNGFYEAKIQGFATRFVIDGVESLKIAAIEIQIKNGKIEGCAN